MNSKVLIKHWFLIFIPSVIYLMLNRFHLFSIELFLSNFAAGANLFIFTISVLIMQVGRTNKPEEFVFRYLTMTTVQMLSFLAIGTAFVVTKKPDIVVFHSLALFGVLLVFQSIGLLIFKDKTKKIEE
jgi:hypothetical protein